MNKKEIKSASGAKLLLVLAKERRRREVYAVAFNVTPQGSGVERALQRARDACDSLDYEITKELERRFSRLEDFENGLRSPQADASREARQRPQRTPTMQEAEAAIADEDKPPAKKVRKKVSKKHDAPGVHAPSAPHKRISPKK